MKDIPIKINGNAVAADEYNPLTQELKNVVEDTGQTLNEADNFQVSKSSSVYATSGDFFVDSGTLNTYVVSAQGTMKSPTDYVDGLRIRFNPTNTNTGVATINVGSLGVKTIKTYSNHALIGGEIQKGLNTELEYDGTNFRLSEHHQNVIINNSFINEMLLSNNVSDPQYDVNISAGSCSGGTAAFPNSVIIVNRDNAFFKKLDQVWAEGTGNGGRASTVALTADTWYHKFALGKVDGTFDAGYDISIDAVNLLADASTYSFYGYLGSVLTDVSTHIEPFYMHQCKISRVRSTIWKNKNTANVPALQGLTKVDELLVIPTPPDLEVLAIIRSSIGTPGNTPAAAGYARAMIYSPFENTPSVTEDDEWTVILGYNPTAGTQPPLGITIQDVVTNLSSQVYYAYKDTGGFGGLVLTLYNKIIGWKM